MTLDKSLSEHLNNNTHHWSPCLWPWTSHSLNIWTSILITDLPAYDLGQVTVWTSEQQYSSLISLLMTVDKSLSEQQYSSLISLLMTVDKSLSEQQYSSLISLLMTLDKSLYRNTLQ
jgi:hypothetical protein